MCSQEQLIFKSLKFDTFPVESFVLAQMASHKKVTYANGSCLACSNFLILKDSVSPVCSLLLVW